MADTQGPQIDVSSDEGWKNRVKAEDAALDEQFREKEEKPAAAAEPEPAAAPGREPPQRFPEAAFEGLVALLATQAMVGLGVLPNPATGKGEKQLPMARYFIDLIGALEKKTSGNLSPQEAGSLEKTLHSLRMTYVELSKDTG